LLESLRESIAALQRQIGGPQPTHDSSGVETNPRPTLTIPPPQLPFLDPPQSADEMGRLSIYRVLKELGRGGMGMVLQAEDPKLKRLVAIKVMRPEIADSAHARKRFLREAQAMAALEHDHIVTVHQVSEHSGVPFLVMPFLKGETLQDRLTREKKLPPIEVIRIGRGIGLGLAAAHARGLIHRDIKPGNIRLEEDMDRVKILDFGLAHVDAEGEQALTHTGVTMGTPGFMSPEQPNGQVVDHRTDLFSLGCVLYVASTGKLPFGGGPMLDALSALATQQLKLPVEADPQVPAKLSEVIVRLLEKDRAKRKATAEGVAKALEGLLREALRQTAAQRAASKMEAAAAKPGPAAAEAIGTPARKEAVPPPAGRGQTVAFAKAAEAPQQKEEPAAKAKPVIAGPREQRELAKKIPSPRKPAGTSRRRVPWLVVTGMGMAALMVLIGIIIIVKWKKSPDGNSGEVSLEIKETRSTEPAAPRSGEGGKNPARYKNSLGMEFALVPKGKFLMSGGSG
jgi:hypothetical protein